MNQEKKKVANENKPTGLALLREPFEPHQISKLPKQLWKAETYTSKNIKKGNCAICGGYHYVEGIIHLDYVGHAALTDRLLDCDPNWNWEPMALDANGLPLIINNQMWIKLTVCGKTVLGFGDAQGKTGANAIKEIIGDALRNAAMRMGAALNLWHKGDLHIKGALIDGETGEVLEHSEPDSENVKPIKNKWGSVAAFNRTGLNDIWIKALDSKTSPKALIEYYLEISEDADESPSREGIANRVIACYQDLISLFENEDELRQDWKNAIYPHKDRIWFFDSLKEKCTKKGQSLQLPKNEAA